MSVEVTDRPEKLLSKASSSFCRPLSKYVVTKLEHERVYQLIQRIRAFPALSLSLRNAETSAAEFLLIGDLTSSLSCYPENARARPFLHVSNMGIIMFWLTVAFSYLY